MSGALLAAAGQGYDVLKTRHLQDYEGLFDRTELHLGTSNAAQCALPTDLRRGMAAQTFDPGLEALLFQYGRYLLISCSRAALPVNLQGLWNDSNDPACHSDYHSNINVQMCYWPAEPDGLSELTLPLFNLIESQLGSWRRATANAPDFNIPGGSRTPRGWGLRTSHNIFGGMGWVWDRTANAWYCRHFWEHYAFTQDREFLQTRAYPILKETTQFWQDHLKKLARGPLVVPDGWSPEHGPHADGVSYNQEIVWDLFNNYVQAADTLGVDQEYRDEIAALRDRLYLPRIGRWGQLQEWMADRDNPNDDHRHTSQLYGLYPGDQINLVKDPAVAAAARVSLLHRRLTGDVREWSFAWRCALWARLRDGARAHEMLDHFFEPRNSCVNLFGFHPPMQIDGNFGMAAAIPEMLVQSQVRLNDGRYQVDFLPALPEGVWKTGSVKGLCVRGGFTVDLAWRDGELARAVLHSVTGRSCQVRYGYRLLDITLNPGESRTFGPAL